MGDDLQIECVDHVSSDAVIELIGHVMYVCTHIIISSQLKVKEIGSEICIKA